MQSLSFLIGEWTVEVMYPTAAHPVVARQRFEWILDGRFVLQNVTVDDPDVPDSLLVLGPENCQYFDSSGMARTYQMSVEDRVWKVWREDPDFWQRFTGTISADGTEIVGTVEKSNDNGATWEHDFAMNYRKA